jgi:hypothetical protein
MHAARPVCVRSSGKTSEGRKGDNKLCSTGRSRGQVTIDDPKYYTRPFFFKKQLLLFPDTDVFEFVCNENEQDLRHTKK